MSDRTPQNQDKFIVRLPDGLRDRIRSAAEENGRSMNAEIVSTLLDKYPEPAVLVTDAAMEDIVDMVLKDGVPRKIERGEKTITVVLQSDGTVITTTSLAPETYELSQLKR